LLLGFIKKGQSEQMKIKAIPENQAVTDKLKKEAKNLKFTEIKIKGGSHSLTEKDTIDASIILR
jgi:hypothetical protein